MKKNKENAPINRVVQFSIIIALFLIIFSGCKDKNSLKIYNYTKSNIVVISARVDGKIISNRELVVHPTPKDRYSFVPIYSSFQMFNPRVLEIELKDLAGVMNASCELGNIKQQGGCLFLASYNGTNQLKCICDSYADFND
jgi:hypothetical protein